MDVDGFNAAKARAAWPELSDLPLDAAVEANLDALRQLVPARIRGTLLSASPQLLQADLPVWRDFLAAFGFSDAQVADALRACPDVFHRVGVYQAGQLLQLLRNDLRLPDDEIMGGSGGGGGCFRWAAGLTPHATRESMAAVIAVLQAHGLGLQDRDALLRELRLWPEVLGWSEQALLQRLAFFEALGPDGRAALAGTLHDAETGWLPGLRAWAHAVRPKLDLLEELLGGPDQAQEFVAKAPQVLALPVEAKLRPVMTALTASAGVSAAQLAELLRRCPKLLAEPRDAIVGRTNFLYDAVGAGVEELLDFPQALLLSLSSVTGPRYFFLARQRHLDALSDRRTGQLDLRRCLAPPLDAFLADVAAVAGRPRAEVAAAYARSTEEWDELVGWCAERAWATMADDDEDVGSGSVSYREQLNLFYVLVQ